MPLISDVVANWRCGFGQIEYTLSARQSDCQLVNKKISECQCCRCCSAWLRVSQLFCDDIRAVDYLNKPACNVFTGITFLLLALY